VTGGTLSTPYVMIEDGNITGYKVNVKITFQLEDPA
jgi:flavin-binding protein dodecin